MGKKPVIIAEKRYLIGRGMAALLDEYTEIEITALTSNPSELRKVLSESKWDLLFLGSNFMPDLDELFQELGPLTCKTKVVLIQSGGVMADTKQFLWAITPGQDEKSLKDTLLKLIESLPEDNEVQDTSADLSERERTVVELVARGLTNREIAEKLNISMHTVISHRKNISLKLGIKTIPGLTVYAILNKIISLEELKS